MLDVLQEYAADHYDKTIINDVPKSEIQLKVTDKLFLDFLLMKIRSKTISYSTMKKKKTNEQEKNLTKDIEQFERVENKTEDDINILK